MTRNNLKKRILATILDYGLFLVVTFAYITFFGHETEDGGIGVEGILALPIPIAWFIYFVMIEGIYGATIGHLGLGLKVLTVDRKEIDWGHSLKRHLLDPIDVFIFRIPAIIAIKNSDRNQRIGDMWAQTIVVDEK